MPPGTRILCLGDSYTVGEAVEQDLTWPYVLTKALGLPRAAVHVVATTGWTTDELLAGIARQEEAGLVSGSYDIVTLLIGVNNQVRGRSCEEYRLQFSELLDLAVRYAFLGKKGEEEKEKEKQDTHGHPPLPLPPPQVLVLSIPDWSCTPYAAAASASIRKVCECAVYVCVL